MYNREELRYFFTVAKKDIFLTARAKWFRSVEISKSKAPWFYFFLLQEDPVRGIASVLVTKPKVIKFSLKAGEVNSVRLSLKVIMKQPLVSTDRMNFADRLSDSRFRKDERHFEREATRMRGGSSAPIFFEEYLEIISRQEVIAKEALLRQNYYLNIYEEAPFISAKLRQVTEATVNWAGYLRKKNPPIQWEHFSLGKSVPISEKQQLFLCEVYFNFDVQFVYKRRDRTKRRQMSLGWVAGKGWQGLHGWLPYFFECHKLFMEKMEGINLLVKRFPRKS